MKEVLAKALARAKAIRSGAYEAHFTDDKRPITMAFRGSRTDYEISLTVGPAEMTVIVHGATSFTRGNAAYWAGVKVPDPGKDVYVPRPTSQLGPILDLTLDRTLRNVISNAQRRFKPTVTDGETGGISAWTLVDRAGALTGIMYVSKDTFDVMRFSGDSAKVGAFDFHGWNETFDIATPPASKVVRGTSAIPGARSSV